MWSHCRTFLDFLRQYSQSLCQQQNTWCIRTLRLSSYIITVWLFHWTMRWFSVGWAPCLVPFGSLIQHESFFLVGREVHMGSQMCTLGIIGVTPKSLVSECGLDVRGERTHSRVFRTAVTINCPSNSCPVSFFPVRAKLLETIVYTCCLYFYPSTFF